jgi:hypothetical protein
MLFWMLCFRRPGRLRACQGELFGEDAGDEAMGHRRGRARREDLEEALAERDELIAKLEERVRVLERIATDDSARLRAEIDSLRDTPTSDGAAR